MTLRNEVGRLYRGIQTYEEIEHVERLGSEATSMVCLLFIEKII